MSLPNDLTDTERRAIDALELGAEQVDEIAQRLGTSTAEALAALTSLEIRGLVDQEPGKLFRMAVGGCRL
jgi:predicted Rossmann fold nucleotide-binding protein DprA/Smf involved in DNA uptake